MRRIGDMEIQEISDSITVMLGKRLIAADARTYKVEDMQAEDSDLAEVVLRFEPDYGLYFSWIGNGDGFDLSVRETSHLNPDAFGRDSSEMETILSTVVGKPLTNFDLFADQFGVVAVRLMFESLACGIAVGHDRWNEEKQIGEFTFFGGDDLFLWSDEIFSYAVNTYGLEKVASKSHLTSP